MDPTTIPLQFGALGIVAFVCWRLVAFVTSSLNGRLDRLSQAVEENTRSNRETVAVMRAIKRELAQRH